MPRKAAPLLPPLEPIKIENGSLDIEYYFRKHYDEIGEAADELPVALEIVNNQLQIYTEQFLITKHRVKIVESSAYFALKNGGFEDRGYGEKQTEAALERAIPLELEVQKVHEEFSVLKAWVNRLQGLQANLQSKLDLLRTFEATRRRLVDDENSD